MVVVSESTNREEQVSGNATPRLLLGPLIGRKETEANGCVHRWQRRCLLTSFFQDEQRKDMTRDMQMRVRGDTKPTRPRYHYHNHENALLAISAVRNDQICPDISRSSSSE